MKDWEGAADLGMRNKRLKAQRLRRWSKCGDVIGAEYPCMTPLVRGPMFKKIPSKPETTSWHENRVQKVYQDLSMNGSREVSIPQLQASFERLCLPLDKETFARYAQDFDDLDPMTYPQFLEFHKHVWANQPAAVRWHAGDPSACGLDNSYDGKTKPELQLSNSLPTFMNPLREVLTATEDMVRLVFKRYSHGKPGMIGRGDLPAILQDLGLPADTCILDGPVPSDLAKFLDEELGNADNSSLSFHEFVKLLNRYMCMLEAVRTTSTSEAKMRKALNSTCKYSKVDGSKFGHV